VSFTPPSPADKATLLDLGETLIEAWSAGSSEEYYNTATDTWEWNAAEGGGTANRTDWKMGLAALAATLYRLKRPRDVAFRLRYRNYAARSVDAWFRDYQDPVTGGMFYTNVSNVANEGQATIMGFANVAIVVKCLGDYGKNRWATQIADALDYFTSQGEKTWYTNGNIMFYKLLAYELGAYATDDADIRQDVEDLWDFTYYPNTVATGYGQPTHWRGCGYIEDTPGTGYFSEVTSSAPTNNHTGLNRFDPIYANAQAIFATLGYILFGDERYRDAADAVTNKMLSLYNVTTNEYPYTGGSRNAGPGNADTDNTYIPMSVWMLGNSGLASYVDPWINKPSHGIEAAMGQWANTTNPTAVRGFGLLVAAVILAAHGRTLA
jgi:hypothetical protein